MPQLPIQHAQRLPTAQAPSAYARPNLDDGATTVARAFQTAAATLQQIDQIQGEAELSTMKRQYQEKSYAALRTYSTTGDPEERQKLINTWSQDTGSIQSERGWVNSQFAKYKNGQDPQWSQTFLGQEVKHQITEADAQADINIASHLETCDIAGVKENYGIKRSMGTITQAAYDQKIKDIPGDMKLAQASLMIREGNPVEARALLNDTKGLTEEQLKRSIYLENLAKTQLSENSDNFQKELMSKLLDAKKLSVTERAAVAESLKRRALEPNNGMSGAEARIMLNYIDSQISGTNVKTDWLGTYDPVRRAIDNIETPEDAKKARFMLMDAANKLATSEKEELTKLLIEKETDPKENAEYISNANRMTTLGLFNPSYAQLKELMDEEQWRTLQNMNDEDKNTFIAAEGIKRAQRLKDEFRKWDKEAGPHTPEQKRKWWDEKTKPARTEKVKSWFARFMEGPPAPPGYEKRSGLLGFGTFYAPVKKTSSEYSRTVINQSTGERMGTNDNGKTWHKIP